jgi:hypothetical protein
MRPGAQPCKRPARHAAGIQMRSEQLPPSLQVNAFSRWLSTTCATSSPNSCMFSWRVAIPLVPKTQEHQLSPGRTTLLFGVDRTQERSGSQAFSTSASALFRQRPGTGQLVLLRESELNICRILDFEISNTYVVDWLAPNRQVFKDNVGNRICRIEAADDRRVRAKVA